MLLGDKQLYYEKKMDAICKNSEMNKIDTKEADKQKQELVNSLGLERYCCKNRLMTYVELVKVVK